MVRLFILMTLSSSCTLVPILGVHERVWCERDYRTGIVRCPDEREHYEVDCELEPLDYSCERR